MERMVAVIRLIVDHLWDIFTGASAEVADFITLHRMVQGENEGDFRFYLRGLAYILTLTAIFPILLVAFGMIYYTPWISVAGIIWMLVTAFLTIAGAPLAALIAAVGGTTEAIVEREKLKIRIENYIKFMKGIFVVETVMILALAGLKINNNPAMFFTGIVAVIALALTGSGSKWKKIVSGIATLVVIASLISFLLPKSFNMVTKWPAKIDNTVSPVIDPGPKTPAGGLTTDRAELSRLAQQASQTPTQQVSGSDDVMPMSLSPVAVSTTYPIAYPASLTGGWRLKVDNAWRELRIPEGVNFDFQPVGGPIDVVL